MLYTCKNIFISSKFLENFCQNQNFIKKNYPKFKVFKTKNCGFGLKTLEDIPKGKFVNEYVGELIDNKELERRLAFDHANNITNYYYLTLDSNRTIDASIFSQFLNLILKGQKVIYRDLLIIVVIQILKLQNGW